MPNIKEPSKFAGYEDWLYVSPKSNGANNTGPLTGIYKNRNGHDKILFKKNNPERMLAEFIGSRLLRSLPAANKQKHFGEVILAAATHPHDPSERDIYIGAKFFNHYLPLHADVRLTRAAKLLDADDENNHSEIFSAEVPHRAKIIEWDRTVDRYLEETNRYENISYILAWNWLLRNKDVHTDNIGTVGINHSYREVFTNKRGIVKVYNHIDIVNFDYDWCLQNITYSLYDLPDDLTFSSPPNYIGWYPHNTKTQNPIFINALEEIQALTKEKIQQVIESAFDDAKRIFGEIGFKNCLTGFAYHIGIRQNQFDLQNLSENIQSILADSLYQRAQYAKIVAEKYRNPRLKTRIQRQFERIYNYKNYERTPLEAFFAKPTPGNIYNYLELFVWPLNVAKNILKLFTEFLPAIIESCGSQILQDHKDSLLATSCGYMLYGIGKITRWIGSRITSPLRSARDTYDFALRKLSHTSLSSTSQKIIAGFFYGISIAFSIAAITAVCLVAPPVLAKMIPHVTNNMISIFSPIIAKAANAPIIHALGNCMSSIIQACGAEATLLTATVSAALIAILPVRALLKNAGAWLTKYYCSTKKTSYRPSALSARATDNTHRPAEEPGSTARILTNINPDPEQQQSPLNEAGVNETGVNDAAHPGVRNDILQSNDTLAGHTSLFQQKHPTEQDHQASSPLAVIL